MPAPSSNTNSHTPYFPTSSPSDDPATLQFIKRAFLAEISSKNMETCIKTQAHHLTDMMERLQADMTILKEEIKEVKEVHAKRKEQMSGKCHMLKIALEFLLNMWPRHCVHPRKLRKQGRNRSLGIAGIVREKLYRVMRM